MADPYRPRFHFTVDNWMNDPVPFCWEGETHLFYQYNAEKPEAPDVQWGHATSRDLVRWTMQPIALAPDTPHDRRGCWTGSVMRHEGKFLAHYTGIPTFDPFTQVQVVAVSDDLTHWTKPDRNPVLPAPPEGFGPCWRDPQVWIENGEWRMIVGSQREGVGGYALMYASPDGKNWTYRGPLAENKIAETGIDFECPDFFELDGRWVLLSSRDTVHWRVGDYDGKRFVETARGVVDGPPYGGDTSPYYAAKSMLHSDGRRLLFSWMREWRGDAERKAAGWAGAQAFARVLSVVDGRLVQAWPKELDALRGEALPFTGSAELCPEEPLEVSGEAERVVLEIGDRKWTLAEGGRFRLFADASVVECLCEGHGSSARVYGPAKLVVKGGKGVRAWRMDFR